jgi:hypothetical protein
MPRTRQLGLSDTKKSIKIHKQSGHEILKKYNAIGWSLAKYINLEAKFTNLTNLLPLQPMSSEVTTAQAVVSGV